MKHKTGTRVLSWLLTLVMVLSMIPATFITAFAAGVSPALVSSLAEVYDGDEARAREELEALCSAGLIDADGNMAPLDVREDGKRVELGEVAQRIADGEEVGALTVNGHAATPEKLMQLQQVNSMLEVLRLIDEDVEITDEHVANLQSLLEGIADGSIDLSDVLQRGEMDLSAQRNVRLLGAGNPAGLPANTGSGTVDATDGKYNAPYISGSDYEANHQFTLIDPENTTWYTDSVAVGGDTGSGYTVTMASFMYGKDFGQAYSRNDGFVRGTAYILQVKATLDRTPTVPISIDWSAASDVIPLVTSFVPSSGTFRWSANDSGLTKSAYVYLDHDIIDGGSFDKWDGIECIMLNAGNAKGADVTFIDEWGGSTNDSNTAWRKAVSILGEDNVDPNSTTSKIMGVSAPAGTYFSGQTIPITVTLDKNARAHNNYGASTLTVNGVECPMLNIRSNRATDANKFQFGYTVKDVDTGALIVTALNSNLVGDSNGTKVTFQGDFLPVTIGVDDGVILSSNVKEGSLDWMNVQCGIDDAEPGDQTVTAVIPFTTGASNTWITGETVEINPAIPMAVPGYENAVAIGYLKSAYLSKDGGATRYPVYVLASGGAEGVALAARFSPTANASGYLRKDTLNLYLDTEVGTTANYFGTERTDAKGFTYYASSGTDAAAAKEMSVSYYVKGCVLFDAEATIDRPNYDEANIVKDAEGHALGFYKADGLYIAVQGDDASKQHDVELVVNEALYKGTVNGVRVEEPNTLLLSYQISDRDNFTFPDPQCFTWASSNEQIATVVKDEQTGAGQIALTGGSGKVTVTLTVGNGSASKAYDLTFAFTVLEGKTPFLNIPEFSRERATLTETDTDVLFASNVTARNASAGKDTTVFTAKLYQVSAVGDAPAGEPAWTGEFASTVGSTLTHITVPGAALTAAGTYAVVIGARYEGGVIDGAATDPVDLSATAYLNVKQAPFKVTLKTLESYSADYRSLPAIEYTVTPSTANAVVQYTVQKSGEAVGARTAVTGGAIPFTAGKPEGLKDAYTVTVYARSADAAADEPWSVDSMLLRVYNMDVLELIVKDVVAGEIGGSTGGTGENVAGKTVVIENRGKLTERYGVTETSTGSAYKLTVSDLNTLRTDMSLQKLISANYGAGVWGLLSDKMQWASSDPGAVSINYKQGGFYSDIRSYSYTSYGPATDFLLVGKDKTGENSVTVTATHAATGKTATVTVQTETLENQLYVFQFKPKAETTIVYTNGKDEKRQFTSDANGELAVYEPAGIASPVVAWAEKDGQTYVGTIFAGELESGERDIASLRLYPTNNLRLRSISNATLTFRSPDGSAYNGAVTLRVGVYKNGVYCPDAKVFLDGDQEGKDGKSDIIAAVANGKLKLRFDPSQFKTENEESGTKPGANAGDNITYVIEYRAQNYKTNYVMLNVSTDHEGEQKATDSVIQLRTATGGGNAPQITRQTIQQYSGGKAVSYTRDVTDYTENIGISRKFNKVELITDYALPTSFLTVDDHGYASSSGEFALYNLDGRKLTGQTERSTVQADQIINLSALKNSTLFVFPFSSSPIGRNIYTMTDANMKADGITDEGANPVTSARVRAMFVRDGMTVASVTLPFGVSNLSHQPDLSDLNGEAGTAAADMKKELAGKMSIGDIFKSINVNDMLKKGFTFLGGLATGGDTPFSLIILPTEDPGVFRIVAFVGYNQDQNKDNQDGLQLQYDEEAMYEDFSSLMEEDDDDEDGEGEGSVDASFSGTLVLEAGYDFTRKEWKIDFRGGSVGLGIRAKYEWSQNFMCGPIPANISFEVGANADLEVSFASKSSVKLMLVDATVGVYLEAFAGLGFDASIAKLKLGIYGRIGADVNFLLLSDFKNDNPTGTKLSINGEIGIRLEVKVLFVNYKKTFASTGFNWTKKWNQYDRIQEQWKSAGYAELTGFTQSGRAYAMRLLSNGAALVTVEGGGEIEDRDYLELAGRTWTSGAPSGRRLMKAAGPMTHALTNVQTNAYPYSNPALTDDGSMFLYISDNDNASELQSVVSYAVKSGSGYENKGAVDTNDAVLADSDVVASGTGSKAFAAWVKQHESPEKEMKDKATYDDLGMMMNATEVYAGVYNGTAWTTERLTSNNVADMSPTVASSGDKAIVAWRSLSATEMPEEGGSDDLTAMFNAENNVNYRIYDGTAWTDAQVAYNGAAGTVNAVDSAMLSDGTALLTYTVRTGEDITTTETFYTLIGADGNVLTTGRLTNDSCTDTNAQVTTVGNQFVLGWYSEHAADEAGSSDEPVVAHDVCLARINADGSVDASFPESIGGGASSAITSDFRFSAPAANHDLNQLSIVWPQKKDSDAAEDAGKYEINAIRFYESGNTVGVTAQTDIAETAKNTTVDHFDTYTDGNGTVYALTLTSDYSSVEGIEAFDQIDLSNLPVVVGNGSAEPSSHTLTILEQNPVANMMLGSGAFPETALEVNAKTNLRELVPGLSLPVQFTVKNVGTSTVNKVTVQLGSISKTVENLTLLPNQSTIITEVYPVPEETIRDVDYTVTADGAEERGTLVLNRPDVGISGMKLLSEENGERTVQVTLTNASGIPLAGSGKTVKLGFYKTPRHEEEAQVGKIMEIASQNDLADVDEGIYGAVQTLDVEDLIDAGADEIPESGIRLYAHAWVEDCDELYTGNNDGSLAFKGLLTKSDGQIITVDTAIEVKTENETNTYIVNAEARNNSLQEQKLGKPVAILLDGEGKAIAQADMLEAPLTLGKEERRSNLSAAFTAEQTGGKTPKQAVVGYSYKVSFDIGNGTGTFGDIYTDTAGHLTLPETAPTPPDADPQLFFAGWYTDATNGDRITGDYTFTGNATVYAHYVTHQHNWVDFAVDTQDAASIVAVCDNTLGHEGETSAKMTISAPALSIYGGTGSAEATVANGMDGLDTPAVVYKQGDTVLAEAPTDAGTYTASITLGEGSDAVTAQVQYTIAKRNVTLTSATREQQYNGRALADDTVAVTGDGWAEGEGATYTVTGSQKVVGSSENSFTYTLNDGTKADNYVITTTPGTLTVTSRTAKYEISPQANSGTFKYDGTEKTVSGFKTETFTVDGNTYTVSGLTAASSGTDAGTYTVSVSGTAVVRDSDGSDVTGEFSVTPLAGTMTVNKREVTLTSATDAKEYDGAALTNDTVAVSGDGWAEGEGASCTVTGTRTLVGTVANTFSYTLNDGTKADNYTITTNNGTLTVNNRNTKYGVTLTADSGEFLYDGTEKTVTGWTIDGKAGGSFTAENGLTYTVSGMGAALTRTDAASYDVTVTGTPTVTDAGGNDVTAQFAVSVEKGTLKINKRSVTLTSATDSKAYDGTALTNDTVTVSGDGWAAGEGAAYTVTGSQTLPESSANAFGYTLNSGTKANNYTITKVEGTLTITNRNDTEPDKKYEITVRANSDTVTYDGQAHTVSGFETLEYTVGGVKYTVSGLSATATETNAGTYTVAVTGTAVVKDGADNDLTAQFIVHTVDGSLTINKTAISGAIVKKDAAAYDGTVSTPGIISDGKAGSNGAIVGADETKQVTYYYQSTAFLKSQTDDIGALDTAEGVYKEITPTTFEPGTHYVLAVVTGDNYNNVPYITQSAFEITQNTETVRTAPGDPAVDGNQVTVAEADRAKSLEYSLDGQAWLPAELDENGGFTAAWADPVTDAALKLRETADENYEKPSAGATGTAPVTIGTFTVTYDANGGVKAPDAVTAAAGRTVIASGKAKMTRRGYTFTGWNASADGTGNAYRPGDKLDAGMTLYAQWEANTYKVRFNANGGKGKMEELTLTYDAPQALTKNAFEKADRVFLGWSLAANASVQYQDQQSVENLAESGNTTLYAVWAKDLYNVKGSIVSAQAGDVTLALVRGNQTFGEPVTVAYDAADQETEFTLNGVPAGIYNLVARQGDVTMTVAVAVADSHVELGAITMPADNASSVVEVRGEDTPAVVVGGLDEVAAAEEIEDRKVTVAIAIETQNEAQAGKAGEAILKESRAQNADFLNLTVTKTISRNDEVESVETMTETKSLLELVIPFDFNSKTGVKLYRYRNGALQALEQAKSGETVDGTYKLDQKAGLIYVYADSFDTYAVAYSSYYPSSGGASDSAAYDLVIAAAENGKVSAGTAAPKAGEKVTVTVTPDAGYEVDAVTATDAKGNRVSVTKNPDGTYSFTQPGSKVTVKATFKKTAPDDGPKPCPKDDTCPLTPFNDLDKNAWYHDGVHFVLENGVMAGYSADTFGPDNTLTRAMVVQVLYNRENKPETDDPNPFSDVSADQWCFNAVRWGAARDVVAGFGGGVFKPDDAVTVEQVAVILHNYSGKPASTGDASALGAHSDWAEPALRWAAEKGLFNGMPYDAVTAPATRAQTAQMLMNYLNG